MRSSSSFNCSTRIDKQVTRRGARIIHEIEVGKKLDKLHFSHTEKIGYKYN